MAGLRDVRITDEGLVDPTSVESLSADDWKKWIRARALRRFDPITGEDLRHAQDPLDPFRCIAAATSGSATLARLINALVLIAREQVHQLSRVEGPPPEGMHEELNLLAEVLYLISDLSPHTVLDTRFNRALADGVVATLIERRHLVPPGVTGQKLIQAAIQFLGAAGYALADNIITELLSAPETSRVTLEYVRQRFPEREREAFREFLRTTCPVSPTRANLQITEYTRRHGVESARRFLLESIRILTEPTKGAVFTLSEVQHLLKSPSIEEFARSGFLYDYRGYLRSDEQRAFENLSTTQLRLADVLYSKASQLTGKKIRYGRFTEDLLWEELVLYAARGYCVPLDPIFLSDVRAGIISIVPYGYVNDIAVAYSAVVENSEHKTIISTWTGESLSAVARDAKEFKFEVGYFPGTAAIDELRECSRTQAVTFEGYKQADIGNLAAWLISGEHFNRRVVVVDVGLIPRLRQAYDDEKRKTAVGRFGQQQYNLRNSQLGIAILKYRKPVLVGVPFSREDVVWGRCIAEVVDKVLFVEEQIHINEEQRWRDLETNFGTDFGPDQVVPKGSEERSFQFLLMKNRIRPLTPQVTAVLDPWVQVDLEFFPKTLSAGTHLPESVSGIDSAS